MADGHTITASSFPFFRTLRPATIECSCGWTGSAPPDLALPDPHTPIFKLFAGHSAHLPAVKGPGKGKALTVVPRLDFGRTARAK
jgi:hypothetical protein